MGAWGMISRPMIGAGVDLPSKLEILAEAAKYDASCASSGAPRRYSLGAQSLGSTQRAGICHSYAPDGRCISLLKILLTNVCVFDCLYCVNRRSSNVRRARFTAAEVANLTIAFYKRNFIEGLFLSSGIIRNPDYTMEQIAEVARTLREEHGFRGYIHLKAVPGASEELLTKAGRHADRLSVNIELPTEASLRQLAPEKNFGAIEKSMCSLKLQIAETKAEKRAPRFAPAGQSTQMIVGADGASDATILQASARLYASYGLRRVYYSAFSPIPDASSRLPPQPIPLVRERRLYQSDWLLRFYGFEVGEIIGGEAGGMLDLDIDPKLAWALRHREMFPVDINTEGREMLLRVPGLGRRTVNRILSTRRHRALRFADLGRLGVSLKTIGPFIIAVDYRPHTALSETDDLRARLVPAPVQLDLFPTHA
jgi:putative DNA modification/repair radical SAM protein